MPTEVAVEYDGWQKLNILEIANTAFTAVVQMFGLSPDWSVTVMACDDARIQSLNTEFRGKPQSTNVLSWPTFDLAALNAGETPRNPPNWTEFEDSLGDVAIAYQTCVAEAEKGNIPIDHHICHLLVHSCLHLLGYDHETEQDAALMENIETKILETMGIADPYC